MSNCYVLDDDRWYMEVNKVEHGYVIFHMGSGEYICYMEPDNDFRCLSDYYWGEGSIIEIFSDDYGSVESNLGDLIKNDIISYGDIESGLIWAFPCTYVFDGMNSDIKDIDFLDGFRICLGLG